NRRMLLVIDDVWKAEDALTFQVGGPRCSYIVTTRFPQFGHMIADSHSFLVSELTEAKGLDLLAHFVPGLVAQEEQQARELVQLVGGLPLALTLVGKYLATLVHTGQPRRLQMALAQLHQAQHRLSLSRPTSLLEHPPNLPQQVPLSLQSAIAVSERHLSIQ